MAVIIAKGQRLSTLHRLDMRQKRLQQILMVLGLGAFVGTALLGTAGMFTEALKPPATDVKTAEVQSKMAQLKAQESGYETVLQREPENQVALKGLVEARLQMNNFPGAVEPLEKLVKLNPNEASYKALLAEVKQRAGKKISR